MGMYAVLRRFDDDVIAQVLRHPPLVHGLLSDDEDFDEQPPKPPGLFAALLGRLPPPLPPRIVVEREADDEAGLDKAWHAIHFMLTGTADETDHPLGFILSGGTTIGNEEVAAGPARAFTARETQEISRQIGAIPREEFLGRYDAPAMLKARVYPHPLWEPDRAEDRNEEYVTENFDALKDFLAAAAIARKGFLIYIG